MTQKINRRQWIGLSLLGGVGLAIIPPLAQKQPDHIIRSILMEKLRPADISDATYSAFLEMYIGNGFYGGFEKAFRAFSAMAWLYPTGVLHRIPQFSAKIRAIEESVVTHFTLSTNFFTSEAVMKGESPVIFISYWRSRPCNNPFATFEKT